MLLRILATLFLCSPVVAQTPDAQRPQILWQRTLEDALAISKTQARPILVAVNMDGESASEQIVRDRYRDAQFVTTANRFVCVVASLFRHTPRDFDEQGRRIVCPRLGEVTCGEHIALEPILFDKFLQGERIAPRHAVIQLDGTQTFDLFQLFDLGELDKKLAEAASKAPPIASGASDALTVNLATVGAAVRGPTAAFEPNVLARLAQSKENQNRTALEAWIAANSGDDAWKRTISILRDHGDTGSAGALRILAARLVDEARHPATQERVEELSQLADRVGARAELGAFAIERLSGLGRFPGSPDLGADAILHKLGPKELRAGDRTRVLASALTHMPELPDRDWLELADTARVDGRSMLDNAPSTAWILAFARWVRENGHVALRAPDTLPEASELERKLLEVEARLDKSPNDAAVQAEFGRTSLALARRKAETQARDTQFFFEDARKWLAQASESRPNDVTILVDRARAAYQLSKFDEQESLAKRALAQMPGLPNMRDAEAMTLALVEPRERIEALRWLGDACARRLSERASGDASGEMEGISDGAWALGLAAASPTGDETDWLSYGSFFGALGLRRDEVAVLQEGATRFPESDALRHALNNALWAGGRPDLIPTKAEWLRDRNPRSGACAWHAGYAHLLAAEDARRREQPDEAIAAYERGEERFHDAIERVPQFAESTQHYLAMSALGRGFAHILAGRRSDAARCLAEAIAIRPGIAGVRDGLDREAIDLLDYSLEWRRGAESDVDRLALLTALEKADPGNAAWARAIADSELREALRAEGRDDRAFTKRYLARSIEIAERGVAIDASDDSKRTLAQSLAIAADIAFDEKDDAEARRRLAEAAPLVGETAPASDAPDSQWRALAVALREKLGAARPRFRPGR